MLTHSLLAQYAHHHVLVYILEWYPTTLGTHHHRSIVIRPKGIKLLNKILTDAGYICTEPDSDINLYISREECQQYQGFSDFWEAFNEKKHSFHIIN